MEALSDGRIGGTHVIRSEVVPDEKTFIVHVHASKPAAAEDWQKIFDDLDRAMDEIDAKLADRDTYYFQIRLRVNGFDAERFFECGYSFIQQYDPWEGYSPDFWRSALSAPAPRQRVERWVARHAKTLKRAEEAMRPTESLWEDEYTQFGEPLVMLLAGIDPTLVAHYETFLELWDLEHAVMIWSAFSAILEYHGERPETAALAQIFAKLQEVYPVAAMFYVGTTPRPAID